MKILRIITVALFLLSGTAYFCVNHHYTKTVDRVNPTISCPETPLSVSVRYTDEMLLQDVTASDDRDGDLTDRIMVQGVSRLLTADTARVTYVVFDEAGNMASCTRTLRYTDYRRPTISLSEPPVFLPFPQENSLEALRENLTAWDLRDGDLTDSVHIAAQNAPDSEEGAFRVNVQVFNSLGDSESIPLTLVIDSLGSENPPLKLYRYIHYLEAGSSFDPADCIAEVQGEDYIPGDRRITMESDVDTSTPGYYRVKYTCSASGRNYTVYLAVVVR